jgi:hypothetical protein
MLLTSCTQNIGAPVPVQQVNALDRFSVKLLFKFRDLEIYRFSDGGYYRYFSYGPGKFLPQQQSATVMQGNQPVTVYHSDGVTTDMESKQ